MERYTVPSGETLMAVMQRVGASLNAPCGGNHSCGKCRVRLLGEAIPAATAEERQLLSERELTEGWRLACAVRGPGEWMVETPEQDAGARVLTAGNGAEAALDPISRVYAVEIVPPALTDQRSDAERVAAGKAFALDALRKLPGALRSGGKELFLTEFAGRITDCAGEAIRNLGVAVDVGTTTMAAYLIDLTSSEQLACASELNPQRSYGGDVISRADHAAQPGGLEELQRLVVGAIEHMTDKMLRQAQASRGDVRHIVCVGNTIMMHLLGGLDPANIVVAPFTPVYASGWSVPADALCMNFPAAQVTLGPCVAGYVGADTVAAALSCDMDEAEKTCLLIDIGTNGEIALGNRAEFICCSAAAGPAFEGAHIRCGSGAQDGAIDHVRLVDGRVEYSVLGGGEAQSLCGSGLVDAVAELLRVGVMDETGRIDEDEAPDEWQEYLFEDDKGLAFSLDGKGAAGVYLCQQDLREVQLAKSAIAAGVEVLLGEKGIGYDEVDTLYLAGGFGNYISQEAAMAIGLLPPQLRGRITPVGNAAGSGARQMLMSRAHLERAERLRGNMRYVELSAQADFQQLFVEKMFFGEDE